MSYTCTDYSIEENWSFGERQLTLTFSSSVEGIVTIGFTECCWIAPFGSAWNLSTTFNLTIRNDTGQINSSPRAKTSPVLRLQVRCNHTITLSVNDPDGDIVRCRWATGNECRGICNGYAIPGAVLDTNSCTIRYQANNGAGYKAVALMIEDFLPGSIRPLSSVAFQFLVLVVSSSQTCSQQPQFVDTTLPQGYCAAIPPGQTFKTQLIADSTASNISISEIQTVSPLGTMKDPVQQIPNTNKYYVNITWTPTISQQNQTHLLCFAAVNSNGLGNEQSCIQLMAGYYPPAPIAGADSPNQHLVHPLNVTLQILFNKEIQRPSKTAFVIIYEFSSNVEIYKIDASLSLEININQNQSAILKITPTYHFIEKKGYYINFEKDAVRGTEGCGPGNDPVVNRTFWTFEIMDVTPPIITFQANLPLLSNENITVSFSSNENVTWQCNLTNGGFTTVVNCSRAVWEGFNLNGGMFELEVIATDDAGNTARAVHLFEVDLTSPSTTIIQHPASISNRAVSVLRFACNEICTFECQFFINNTLLISSPCNTGTFSTPSLTHGASYTLSVVSIDQVGNKAKPSSYTWETDFEGPMIFGVSNTSVLCNTSLNVSYTGQAQAMDNRSPFPSITFTDVHLGCSIKRTWMARDQAGNVASLVQLIDLEYSPTLSLLPQLFTQCNSRLNVNQAPDNTINPPNPCSLSLSISYEDSVSVHPCPGTFVRNWTVSVCSRTISQTQNVSLYDICDPYDCGRNENIPRGICSLGGCKCNSPWTGSNCSVLMLAPMVEPVSQVTLQEYQQYSVYLNLSQGTPPISWSLVSGPYELTIDQLTSEVIWNMTQAGNHTVTVLAENQVGRVTVTWSMQVEHGYNAILNAASPSVNSAGPEVHLQQGV